MLNSVLLAYNTIFIICINLISANLIYYNKHGSIGIIRDREMRTPPPDGKKTLNFKIYCNHPRTLSKQTYFQVINSPVDMARMV